MGISRRRWTTPRVTLIAASAAMAMTSVSAAGGPTVVPSAIGVVDGPVSVTKPAVRVTPPGPTLGGCPMFPASNPWNLSIRDAPLNQRSSQIIATIQANGSRNLHPDFGENLSYGIPYVIVPADQGLVPITYTAYGNESDPGPFPIPLNAPVEAGSDGHVLVLRQGTCELFELGVANRSGNGWTADVGVRFSLTTGALRTIGWTSADAAGLPILPGLVRYDEVASGSIRHAIRVTFGRTQRGFILPATHFASADTNPNLPAMGLRLRLRADADLSHLTGQALVIARAMQDYGLIVGDNGSNWYFQGAPDAGWNDNELNLLKAIPGTSFEVVDTGPVLTG